jgi:hypothetical protein
MSRFPESWGREVRVLKTEIISQCYCLYLIVLFRFRFPMSKNATTIQGKCSGNPLLYSTLTIPVEPYWLYIIQALTVLFIQRLYNRFWPWKKDEERTWLTVFEVYLFKCRLDSETTRDNNRKENAEPGSNGSTQDPLPGEISDLEPVFHFNGLDLLFSLFSIVQFIMICVRQSRCLYSIEGSLWRCFNSFGYDINNYGFFGVYTVAGIRKAKKSRYFKPTRSEQFIKFFVDICSGIFCFSLVFVLTNTLPMMFIYHVIPFPFAIGTSIIYMLVTIICLYLSVKERSFSSKNLWLSIGISAWFFSVGIIISIYFNYSQYYYFGESYIQTIIDEYRSRDTLRWMVTIKSSLQQKFHTILNFF